MSEVVKLSKGTNTFTCYKSISRCITKGIILLTVTNSTVQGGMSDKYVTFFTPAVTMQGNTAETSAGLCSDITRCHTWEWVGTRLGQTLLLIGGDGVILQVPVGTLGRVGMQDMTHTVSMGKVVAIDANPLTKELVFMMVMPSGLVKVCLTTGPFDGQFQWG